MPTIIGETIGNGKIVGNLWRGGLEVGGSDRKRYPAPAHQTKDAWRRRTVSARTVRIPSGLLDQVRQDKGAVVEEPGGGEQVLSVQRRVELMGARARERWEKRLW